MAVKKTEQQAPQGAIEVQKPPSLPGTPGGAPRPLNASIAPVAAMVSMALTMAALGAVIFYVATHSEMDTWLRAVAFVKMAVLVGLVGVGVAMLRSRPWAQQMLLVVWLLVTVYSVVILLVYVMWDTPGWWEANVKDWPLLAVILPTLFGSAAAVVLLILASAAKSRVRYASMVSVSAVAAIMVAVGVNISCHRDYPEGLGFRTDIESLGRYGITDRTVRILRALKEEVTLTCVYLPKQGQEGDDEKSKNEYHDRILEYLEGLSKKMGREDKKIKIVDVTRPIEQAKLQARLRQRHRDAQPQHIKLLEEDFLPGSAKMLKALRAAETRWGEMPEEAFLTQFGLSAGVSESFRSSAKRVGEIAKSIRDAEADMSALPDYADLVSQLKGALDNTQSNMETIIRIVKKVKDIPAPVAKSRQGVLDAMAKAGKAVEAMMKTLDGVSDGKVKAAQAAAVLGAFAKAAPAAAEELRIAADKLRLVGGKDNADVLRNSAFFAMTMLVPMPDGSMASARGELVTNLEQIMAPNLDKLGEAANETVKHLKPDTQLESLKSVLSMAEHWSKQFARAQTLTGKALAGLAKPDKDTAAAFKQAEDGTLFNALIEPVKKIIETAGKLPDVKDAALSSDVNEGNIVIIEVGAKTKVATFDEVFPRQQRLSDQNPGLAGGERAFNGDSAIASKMLKMGQGPFGTVIIVYFDPPPQMMGGRRPMPRAPLPLPPNNLGELTKSIEAGNYKVEQWNMSNPDGRPKTDESLKTVLLVLPPPPPSPFSGMMGMPPSPQFGPNHIARIRQEIDAGTAAIFLTTYQPTRLASTGFGPPMPVRPNIAVNTYLADDWGIEVVRDARLIMGNPDSTRPGVFKINVEAFTYLPISTFSDHAIGRPLQGQRVFWLDACPLEQGEKETDGVTIEPLLTVPGAVTNVWGTKVQIRKLAEAIREGGGLISPVAGDVMAPMHLAMAATRKEDPEAGRQESKIVAMTVGASMLDWYVTRPIGVSDGKGGFSFDKPPVLNTTLVVNSLYWLTDKVDYIAAGPATGKTIGVIDEGTETALKVISLAGIPLIVLAIGSIVMFFRKR